MVMTVEFDALSSIIVAELVQLLSDAFEHRGQIVEPDRAHSSDFPGRCVQRQEGLRRQQHGLLQAYPRCKNIQPYFGFEDVDVYVEIGKPIIDRLALW